MAYASSAVAPRTVEFKEEKAPRSKGGPLRRLFEAIEQANIRQAEREIARYLSRRGGKFTDEAEREIERRFLSNQ